VREFLLGVISSLVAAALSLAAGWAGLPRLRKGALRLLSRMTGMGVVAHYPHQKSANAALSADLGSARWVRVLAGRGNELTRDSFQTLWQRSNTRLESVRVLLPDPADPAGWMRQREEDIRQGDPGFVRGVLAAQVTANLEYLSAIASANPAVTVRLYDAPHTCRIIATDQVVYFTPYLPAVHGRHSPCLVFRSGGIMYEHALETFALLWGAGSPVDQKD